jgi:hypothetical protein
VGVSASLRVCPCVGSKNDQAQPVEEG